MLSSEVLNLYVCTLNLDIVSYYYIHIRDQIKHKIGTLVIKGKYSQNWPKGQGLGPSTITGPSGA